MPFITTRLLPFFLILTCSATLLAADDLKSYPITLHHPQAVGNAYTIHHIYDRSSTLTTTPDGRAPTNSKTSQHFDLTGRLDITQISPKGQPKAFTLTIEKLTIDPPLSQDLPPGTVIEASLTESATQFKRHDGTPLADDTQKALTQLFLKLERSDVTLDDAIGSKTPRKPGDSWDINKDAYIKRATADGFQLDPKTLDGKVTLKDIKTLNNTDLEQIAETISFTSTALPIPRPSYALDRLDVKADITYLVPLNPTLPIQEIQATEILHTLLHSQTSPLKIESTSQVHHTITFTPLKK